MTIDHKLDAINAGKLLGVHRLRRRSGIDNFSVFEQHNSICESRGQVKVVEYGQDTYAL